MPPQRSIATISSCRDIVQCAFNLNDFEVEVFRAAASHGPLRADELADRMGRERSGVYRALQKLLSCGMCLRETRSLEKGGYYHVYSAIDKGRSQDQDGAVRGGVEPEDEGCAVPLR